MARDEPQIFERTCDNCGVTGEHVRTGDRVVCVNCGVTNDTDIGRCVYTACPDPATHLLVVNPVRESRTVEYYCEEHAPIAADETRDAEDRELFYGPLALQATE